MIFYIGRKCHGSILDVDRVDIITYKNVNIWATHLNTSNFFVINAYDYDTLIFKCTADEIHTVLDFRSKCRNAKTLILVSKCRNKQEILSLCNTDRDLNVSVYWDKTLIDVINAGL
jgi:hypothetical protein